MIVAYDSATLSRTFTPFWQNEAKIPNLFKAALIHDPANPARRRNRERSLIDDAALTEG